MAKSGNILVIDDNQSILASLELLLPLHFENITCIKNPNLIAQTMQSNPDIDVVLLDMNFRTGINNGNEGLYWLSEIKRIKPNVSIILFTAYADIELAIKSIRIGAIDFIEKPWNNRKLIETIKNGINLSRGSQPELTLEPEPHIIPLEEMECEMIKAAIKTFSGNISEVASKLGITRQTLYNKMKRHGL